MKGFYGLPNRTAALLGLVLPLLTPGVAHSQDWLYTVRAGDNLWNLTEKYLIDKRYWRKLQALNNVTRPRHLPPGMRLRIPIAWMKVKPVPVRVVAVHGDASATLTATGERISVHEGLTLTAGDVVTTGPESNVRLQFADGSKLLLRANSHLQFDTLSAYGDTGMVDTRLRLRDGDADARAAPRQGAGTRYEIWTPAAVSAVRGTEYRIGVGSKRTEVRTEVLDGKVGVTGAGKTAVVPRGFGTVARSGRAPQAPRRLLPPPDLSQVPRVIERVPLRLSWPALHGAVAYHAQISATSEFESLLLDRRLGAARFRGPDLPDGEYALRVRGIDAVGLGGLDAYHRFTVDARPQPPFLVEPKQNAVVRTPRTAFFWSEPDAASSYHFQLADSDKFTAPLVDIAGYSSSRLALDRPLEAGVYYWRVAIRDTSGEQGPFSDAQQFTLRPAPADPALEEPEMTEDSLVFRWVAGPPGQRYQFQMAEDSGFDRVVADTTVSKSQVAIERPDPGFYYLRVRTIDTDGFAGPYGAPQRFNVPPTSYWPLAVVGLFLLLLAL